MKTQVQEDIFDNLNNEKVNYFLGLLATDGSIYENRIELALAEKDLDIVEQFKEFLDNKVTIREKYKTIKDKTFKSYRSAFRSNNIVNTLNGYGITKRKTLNLKLTIPFNYNLLRGIIDGDGCFLFNPEKYCSKLHIVSASKDFINQIIKFYEQENYKYNLLVVIRGKSIYYNLNICGQKDLLRIINNLYLNANVFSKRKYATAQQIRNNLVERLETQGTSVRNPEASLQLNEE